jgi:beta-fructofuranosidase
MPDEEYDRNGCYSGSAVDNNGTLTLCYTGNVKFDDGGRTAWQCLATENADGTFRKLGPVLPLPEGYTGHVRDPKVWRHEGAGTWCWARRIGKSAARCCCSAPRTFMSGAARAKSPARHQRPDDAGYMWECPDLFPLGDQHILICCPQGWPAKERFLNTYPAVWMAAFRLRTRVRPRRAARAGRRV